MMSSLTPFTISPAVVGGSLVALGILVLLGMLVHKELAVARNRADRFKLFGQVLFIGIAPLLIVFLLVVIQNMSRTVR